MLHARIGAIIAIVLGAVPEIGENRTVAPGAESAAPSGSGWSINDFADREGALVGVESIVPPVAVGMVIAGGGVEAITIVNAQPPSGGVTGAGHADPEGGGVIGWAGIDGVGGDKGGPAEAAINQVGTGVGAREFCVREQGSGA